MRLTVFQLEKITPDLLIDLANLHLPVAGALDIWLQKRLENEHYRLWVAKFNGKYIGFLSYLLKSSIELDWIEVREATRQRGVGKFLLQQSLVQWSPNQPVSISPSCSEAMDNVQRTFFRESGFVQRLDGSWILHP